MPGRPRGQKEGNASVLFQNQLPCIKFPGRFLAEPHASSCESPGRSWAAAAAGDCPRPQGPALPGRRALTPRALVSPALRRPRPPRKGLQKRPLHLGPRTRPATALQMQRAPRDSATLPANSGGCPPAACGTQNPEAGPGAWEGAGQRVAPARPPGRPHLPPAPAPEDARRAEFAARPLGRPHLLRPPGRLRRGPRTRERAPRRCRRSSSSPASPGAVAAV